MHLSNLSLNEHTYEDNLTVNWGAPDSIYIDQRLLKFEEQKGFTQQ